MWNSYTQHATLLFTDEKKAVCNAGHEELVFYISTTLCQYLSYVTITSYDVITTDEQFR